MAIKKKSIINNIKINSNIIQIYFDFLYADYAWLEDNNKHQCNVVSCTINNNVLEIDFNSIFKFLRENIIFKLSLSNEYERCEYSKVDITLLNHLNETVKSLNVEFGINKNDELTISCKGADLINDTTFIQNAPIDFVNNRNKLKKSSLLQCPLKILAVGSCFSRSMFKSDEYFNPDYKTYFKVCYTSFHNSIISIMSKPIENSNYKNFTDLYIEGIKDYIDMEFKKNLFDIIDDLNPDYIVIDNYADAILPIVNTMNSSYVTYNKYFSESIYKRNFSKCEVILPSTTKHTKLYSEYLDLFKNALCKRGLENKVILIGGRLSMTKIESNSVLLWPQQNWIIPSNNYWDTIDQLFLRKLPVTTYIDFRKTKWVSDTNSPLIGGATPSHYQSGYYKEMFNQLKTYIFN